MTRLEPDIPAPPCRPRSPHLCVHCAAAHYAIAENQEAKQVADLPLACRWARFAAVQTDMHLELLGRVRP